jgi:hypothetical protein
MIYEVNVITFIIILNLHCYDWSRTMDLLHYHYYEHCIRDHLCMNTLFFILELVWLQSVTTLAGLVLTSTLPSCFGPDLLAALVLTLRRPMSWFSLIRMSVLRMSGFLFILLVPLGRRGEWSGSIYKWVPYKWGSAELIGCPLDLVLPSTLGWSSLPCS